MKKTKKTAKILWGLAKGWTGYLLYRRPIWAILYVTKRCYLSCLYCRFKDNNVKDATLENIFRNLDGIKRVGCNIVSITGGEPTLREDLPEILEYCKRNKLISYLSTNGFSLSYSLVNKLGQAGLDIINVSVDSIHDNENSKKTLDQIQEGLQHLIKGREKYGFTIICNQVITPENTKDIIPLLEKMKDKRVYVAHGFKFPHNNEFSQPHDYKELKHELKQLIQRKRKGYPILTSKSYLKRAAEWIKEPFYWDCRAGEAFFTVDMNGSVRGCDQLSSLDTDISNLEKNMFSEIRQKTQALEQFAKCSTRCMINCAFESSYPCFAPLEFAKELPWSLWALMKQFIFASWRSEKPKIRR